MLLMWFFLVSMWYGDYLVLSKHVCFCKRIYLTHICHKLLSWPGSWITAITTIDPCVLSYIDIESL